MPHLLLCTTFFPLWISPGTALFLREEGAQQRTSHLLRPHACKRFKMPVVGRLASGRDGAGVALQREPGVRGSLRLPRESGGAQLRVGGARDQQIRYGTVSLKICSSARKSAKHHHLYLVV